MALDPRTSAPPAPRPVRFWPAALLVGAFWAFQFVIAQLDLAMFARFLSNALGTGVALLLFLVLWLANGTVPGRTRLAGLGLLLGGAGLGIWLSHPSYQPVGFLMASAPFALTGWVGWMIAGRSRPGGLPIAALGGVFALVFGLFDLVRWDGLDGRLRSSVSWRWSTTAEQAFLAARPAGATPAAATRAWSLRPGDWPGFRGIRRDGVARGVRIDTDWTGAPPERVWREKIGPGWSSMIVVDGFLVTQEQRGEMEAVACYDAQTGREIWIHEDRTRFTEGISGAGPRATPTYHEGRIYALGANGRLLCLEARSGKVAWSRDLAREVAAPAPQWGFSASPLVCEGRVIVFIGGPGARGTVALDAASGAPSWARLVGKESYSSAELVTFQGIPQVLVLDNKSLVSLSPRDGSVLWERPGPGGAAIPMLQPHPVEEGRLLVAAGPGLALLEVRQTAGAWTVSERWATERFRPSFSDLVVYGGHIYGFDDGVLACADLKTGERLWKKGRYGSGQILLLEEQGVLLVLSEKGELALVEARPEEPPDVARIPALDGKTWNHLALAQDHLYVRNGNEIACYRLRAPKSP